MTWEAAFSLANSSVLPAWAALILLPRWPWLMHVLRYGVPGALAVAYAALVLVYFFRVEGGGFNALAEVRALLSTEPTLLAGWIHYLAFDLLVGTVIAEQLDRLGVSRLLQAPVLVTTFMFGPAGYLAYLGLAAGARFSTGRNTVQEGTP
jgi:Domain of unknown function (DUF4281)